MKKKILICLLCVLGLFCGLTCFAAEVEPGIQNPDFVVPDGYTETTILSFYDDGSLTIPANVLFVCESIVLVADESDTSLLYLDALENKLVYNDSNDSSDYISIELTSNDGYYYWHTNVDKVFDVSSNSLYFNESLGLIYNIGVAYSGNISSSLVDGLSSIVGSVGNMFAAIFVGAASVIYNNGSLTIVGWLLLIGLAITLFMFGLRFIRGLINKARAR